MMLNAFIFTVTSLKCSDVIAMDVRHRTKKDQRKKEKPRYVSRSKGEMAWHPGAEGRVCRGWSALLRELVTVMNVRLHVTSDIIQ